MDQITVKAETLIEALPYIRDFNNKKVVVKYRATTKPDKDDKDDDDDEIWKKEKDYTRQIESYMTLYLYKGKVIGQGY